MPEAAMYVATGIAAVTAATVLVRRYRRELRIRRAAAAIISALTQ